MGLKIGVTLRWQQAGVLTRAGQRKKLIYSAPFKLDDIGALTRLRAMDVHITERNTEVSEELRQAATAAMQELAADEPRLTLCKVVFAETNDQQAVAAVCAIKDVGSAVAHAEGKDWKINVGLLKDRLGERIRVVCEEAEAE